MVRAGRAVFAYVCDVAVDDVLPCISRPIHSSAKNRIMKKEGAASDVDVRVA